jgi:hypothetical protein
MLIIFLLIGIAPRLDAAGLGKSGPNPERWKHPAHQRKVRRKNQHYN